MKELIMKQKAGGTFMSLSVPRLQWTVLSVQSSSTTKTQPIMPKYMVQYVF